MSSKKEEWKFTNDGGTKTTTKTDDDGSKTVIVQDAHQGWLGGKYATSIISEEKITPPKK